jgi:hypothetical protein
VTARDRRTARPLGNRSRPFDTAYVLVVTTGRWMALAQPSDWFDQAIRPWLAAAPVTHKVLTWAKRDMREPRSAVAGSTNRPRGPGGA